MRGLLGLLNLMATTATLGAAQVPSDWADCSGDDPDLKIVGCSRIISNPEEEQPFRIRAYNYRANALRLEGKLDAAIADYDEAIRLDSEYAFPHNGRGLTWRAKGDTERALVDFSEAIRLNPGYAKTYNNRGEVWRSKGELDRAIKDFNEAIGLDPEYFLAHFNRGLVFRAKGDFDPAIEDFSEAIRIEPRDAFSFFHRGLIWRAKDETEKALEDFNSAIRFDPSFGIAYLDRAVINLYAKKDSNKALVDLDGAGALDPANTYIALWNTIVRQRIGFDNLRAKAASIGEAWPGPVLQLVLGKLTPENVIAVVHKHSSSGASDEMCEANFYSGVFSARLNRNEVARQFYQAAFDGCDRLTIEWYAAKAELKNLEREGLAGTKKKGRKL
jgi:tetratricopeptide (TPR) repeat protein